MGQNKKSKKSKEGRKKAKLSDIPAVIAPTEDAPVLKTAQGAFDLEDPVLPGWIADRAFKSAGYPYDEPIKNKLYEEELTGLQVELVKLQRHVTDKGRRLVLVLEGRDAAGKGGTIFVIRQYMNPRTARTVALPKPTETERGQWYFQRYAAELPTAGEIVMFDRSWYNRAGVEPVMGFCTEEEHRAFLAQAPEFEKALVNDGIVLFKFWLNMGREMQLKRFHERRHNPLKVWKLSPIDYKAMGLWGAYTQARDAMLAQTHRPSTPWTIVRANDQKRARLNVVRHLLSSIDYPGKDPGVVRQPDPLILGGPELLGKD
jgi:polyphosphate kinase 2